MGIFVDNKLGIKVAVEIWRRAVKQKDLHYSRCAIRGRGKAGVIRATAVLRIGFDGVVSQSAAAEIRGLEIARGFGEAKVVKLVVHPVAPVKEIYDAGIAVGDRVLSQIKGEIENAIR